MRRFMCVLLVIGLLTGSAGSALTGEWDAIARIEGNESAFLVRRDGLWGMIDAEGKTLVKPMFNAEPEFAGGYAVVSVPDPNPREGFSGEEVYGSFYGIISDAGEIILEPEYDELKRSGDGMMILYELGDSYHFLNLETGKKLPGSYDRARMFEGEYAAVAMNGAQADKNVSAPEVIHWGTIDRNGKTGIHMGYEYLELGENDIALVKLGEKYGYVHASGEEITRWKYDIARPFAGGVGIVAVITGENNYDTSEPYAYGWGAIDEKGNELLPCEYENVEIAIDGRIAADAGNDTLYFEVRDGKAVQAAD